MRRSKRYTIGAAMAAATALLIAPTAVNAQAVTLDEGEYRIIVRGQPVGTETFSIRQSGTGANAAIIAQGRISVDTVGAQEIQSSLEVRGPVLRASGYQVAVRGAGDEQRIAGRMIGGRFSAKIVSPAGETMREYLASDGAVVVDEDLAHHYYFLAQGLKDAPYVVPMILPRRSRQVSARVSEGTSTTVQVGGKSVAARSFTIEPAGVPPRTIWVDAQGRVLRVEVPSKQLVVERTTLP